MMDEEILQWLLNCDEPWTRYRTRLDLLGCSEDEPLAAEDRRHMLAHPQVQALIAGAASWPGYTLLRHNDARHPLYQLSTLADFGLHAADVAIQPALEAVLAHISPEGAFQTLLNISKSFGGSGEDQWTWMACDAPTLLYVLLAMGLGKDDRVRDAVTHLASLAAENGWRCAGSPEVGKFHGPGRRADPCPIANVYALKALAQDSDLAKSSAAQAGIEMLLGHWEHRQERKFYLFGMGSDFKKLKYPFIWYDMLHVIEVLSQFPTARYDPRFQEMLAALTAQGDGHGRYTAGSIYTAWKGWSFADKKNPSPWLTFLVLRIQKRIKQEF